jgi:hypothetical protein
MADETPFEIALTDGRTPSETMAHLQVGSGFRNAFLTSIAGAGVLNNNRPEFHDVFEAVQQRADAAKSGNLEQLSETMAAQVVSLDALFTDLARRSYLTLGDFPEASMKLMGLALKAQSNARATAEALARIHQPREQVVRHVHVHEGGQAVVAEQIHHHGQGGHNVEEHHQPHEQSPSVAALPGADPLGNGVPITGGAREEAVPVARRREGKRGACRQQQRAEARDADS